MTNGTLNFIQIGKLIIINFSNTNFSVTSGTFSTILNLTVEPIYEYGGVFSWAYNGTDVRSGFIKITTDKKVQIWANSSNVTYAYGSIAFMIK